MGLKMRLNQQGPVAFHARSTLLELARIARATMMPEDGKVDTNATQLNGSIDLQMTVYADGTVDIFDKVPK